MFRLRGYIDRDILLSITVVGKRPINNNNQPCVYTIAPTTRFVDTKAQREPLVACGALTPFGRRTAQIGSLVLPIFSTFNPVSLHSESDRANGRGVGARGTDNLITKGSAWGARGADTLTPNYSPPEIFATTR